MVAFAEAGGSWYFRLVSCTLDVYAMKPLCKPVNLFYYLIVGTATQLVILPHRIGQGDGILLLCYSMKCVIGLAIFLF